MTDISTWAAEKAKFLNCKILFRGDKFLVNTCHWLRAPEGTTSGAVWAVKFVEFVAKGNART